MRCRGGVRSGCWTRCGCGSAGRWSRAGLRRGPGGRSRTFHGSGAFHGRGTSFRGRALWLSYTLLLLRSNTLLLGGALLLLWGCALRFHGTLLLLWSCTLWFHCPLLLLRSGRAVGFYSTLLLRSDSRTDALLRCCARTVLRSGGTLLLGGHVVLLDGYAALLFLTNCGWCFRDVRCAGGNARGTGKGNLRWAAVVGVVELRAVL